MSRACTICSHCGREAIEIALVRREPYRNIAERFSVSLGALSRHTKEHLPALLAKAHDAKEASRADDLLKEVRELKGRAGQILDRTELDNPGLALRAISEIRSQLELLARLAGELRDAPTVNLWLSPEWVELRAVIVGALEPYEEARESVLRALEGAANGGANGGA